MKRTSSRGIAALSALLLFATACGGGDNDTPTAPEDDTVEGEDNGETTEGEDAGEATSDPVTLTFAHYLPEGQGTVPESRFAELVNEYSNGSVTVEIEWAGALGAPAELPFLVEGGAVDMAAIVPAFNVDAFPAIIATQLIWWSSGDIETDLRRQHDLVVETHDMDIFVNEWTEYNQKRLFVQNLPPYYFYSEDSDCSLDGLRGQRIRSLGRDLPRAFEAIGVTPLDMTTPEMYEGLDRGTVDRVTLPPQVFMDGDFFEVASYACGPIFWLGAGHTITINLGTWESLGADQHEAIERAAEEVTEFSIEFYVDNQTETLELHTEEGVEFTEFPEEDFQALQDASPDFLEEWLSDREAAGQGDEAREVYDKMLEIRDRSY
jgi:TRAP-type transport system periplasmic protein